MKNSCFSFFLAFLVLLSLNCGFGFRSTIDTSFLGRFSALNRLFGNFARENRFAISSSQSSSTALYGLLGFNWGQKSEKGSSTATSAAFAQKVTKNKAAVRPSERKIIETKDEDLEEEIPHDEEGNVIKQKDPVKRLFRYIGDYKKWFERNAIPASSSSLKTKGFSKTNRFKMDALIAFSLPPKARAYYFQHLLNRLATELGFEEIEKFNYFKRYLNRLEDRIDELEGDCQIEGEEYQAWLKQHREKYIEDGLVVPGAGKRRGKTLVEQQDDFLQRKKRIAYEKQRKKEKEEEELEKELNILDRGLQKNENEEAEIDNNDNETVKGGFNPYLRNPYTGEKADEERRTPDDADSGPEMDMLKKLGLDGLLGGQKLRPFQLDDLSDDFSGSSSSILEHDPRLR
jgi:hypothetical protein